MSLQFIKYQISGYQAVLINLYLGLKFQMSTFPQIFRSTKSSIMKPRKQGGMFTIKFSQTSERQSIQPQQFFSTNLSKISKCRGGDTSQTFRSHKILSYTGDARNISSQSENRPSTRNISSRQSSLFKEAFKKSRINETPKINDVIGENTQTSVEQAESIILKLNQNIRISEKISQEVKVVCKLRKKTQQQLENIQTQWQNQIHLLKQSMGNQFTRLRTKLSEMRRNTGMQIKMNRIGMKQVQQELQIISTVFNKVNQKFEGVHQACMVQPRQPEEEIDNNN